MYNIESICSYFWKLFASLVIFVTGGTIVATFTFLAVFGISTGLVDLIICLYFYLSTGLWLGDATTDVGIVFLISLVGVVVFFSILRGDKIIHKIRYKINPDYKHEMILNRRDREKSPGFLKLAYQSHKEKYCALIEFE